MMDSKTGEQEYGVLLFLFKLRFVFLTTISLPIWQVKNYFGAT
jgi:hypothetical protein